VHFYNIKPSLAQPQMMVVGDVQDMFMPLLDEFLYDATESEHVIDQLMIQIPTMFPESEETETILGPFTDVEVAAFDSDKAITVEVKRDDKLPEEDVVYIQVLLRFL
jgi:protein transport protein SEC24